MEEHKGIFMYICGLIEGKAKELNDVLVCHKDFENDKTLLLMLRKVEARDREYSVFEAEFGDKMDLPGKLGEGYIGIADAVDFSTIVEKIEIKEISAKGINIHVSGRDPAGDMEWLTLRINKDSGVKFMSSRGESFFESVKLESRKLFP